MEISIRKLSEQAKAKIYKMMPTAKTISFDYDVDIEEAESRQIDYDSQPEAIGGGVTIEIMDVYLLDDEFCQSIDDIDINEELSGFVNI